MPDVRHHRGAHPEDPGLFSAEMIPGLRAAVGDLSWLLTREYAVNGAMKLVGDRYNLTARQRNAVQRCACSDQSLKYRTEHRIPPTAVAGRLLIDGYNVLTTIEAALSKAFVFIARDGCVRDIASIHGSYRKVDETIPALQVVARALEETKIGECVWYLDAPVSNSGRLKGIIQDLAAEQHYPWQVQIVPNPDPVLAEADEIIATADSVILDRCHAYLNLVYHIIATSLPDSRIVDLTGC